MNTAPSRRIHLAILGAAALAVAGGAAFWTASRHKPASAADQVVTVNATACAPMAITVAGGRRSFQIVNDSDRPIEWEIVDGVMVVAERENIAPGFRATLDVQLRPGSYGMTCGLLSNPRGTLTVTPSDEASADASEVTVKKFLGPLSEYRVYLVLQGNRAVKAAESLRDAIARGDLAAARQAWQQARLPYRRIEPVAFRISDLENRIDPRAAYLAGREDDPGFTGYHRIEYGLFARESMADLLPVAQQLVTDLHALSQRLKQVPLDPAMLIALPGDAAIQIAQGQVPQGENSYADNDPQDLAATIEGIGKLTGLLGQVVASVDPALQQRIAQDQQRAADSIAALQGQSYARIDAARRQSVAADLTRLAQDLGQLPPVIGVH